MDSFFWLTEENEIQKSPNSTKIFEGKVLVSPLISELVEDQGSEALGLKKRKCEHLMNRYVFMMLVYNKGFADLSVNSERHVFT